MDVSQLLKKCKEMKKLIVGKILKQIDREKLLTKTLAKVAAEPPAAKAPSFRAVLPAVPVALLSSIMPLGTEAPARRRGGSGMSQDGGGGDGGGTSEEGGKEDGGDGSYTAEGGDQGRWRARGMCDLEGDEPYEPQEPESLSAPEPHGFL